jgi:hypothetical protein
LYALYPFIILGFGVGYTSNCCFFFKLLRLDSIRRLLLVTISVHHTNSTWWVYDDTRYFSLVRGLANCIYLFLGTESNIETETEDETAAERVMDWNTELVYFTDSTEIRQQYNNMHNL